MGIKPARGKRLSLIWRRLGGLEVSFPNLPMKCLPLIGVAALLFLAACESIPGSGPSGKPVGPTNALEARQASEQLFPDVIAAEKNARLAGKTIQAPQIRNLVRAIYPAAAKADFGPAAEATVWVAFVVNAQGRTERVTPLNYQRNVYGDAAIEAVRQWTYTPGSIDRTPTPMVLEVSIKFGNYL